MERRDTSPENAHTMVTSSEKGEITQTASNCARKGREKTKERLCQKREREY